MAEEADQENLDRALENFEEEEMRESEEDSQQGWLILEENWAKKNFTYSGIL